MIYHGRAAQGYRTITFSFFLMCYIMLHFYLRNKGIVVVIITHALPPPPPPPALLASYIPALALSLFEDMKFISKFLDVLYSPYSPVAFKMHLFCLFSVCGNKKGKTKMEHIELRVLQPTMSPSKMVLGDVLTGK